MNKYEKAWSDCFEMVEVSVEPSYMQKFENGADTLRQLVDRTTPMKPKGSLCAVCNELVFEDDYYCDYKHTYCPNCGQAIDWSDEDAVIKQIPIPPTITIDGEFEHHDCKFCDDGYCGYKGITIANYCQNCGQRWTRWEDENE